MKKLYLGGASAVVIALATAGAAGAADLSVVKAPAYQAAGYSWAGAYFGGHIGHTRTSVWDDSQLGGPSSVDNVFSHAGVQLGYNWQSGRVVYGIEGDVSFGKSRNHFSDQFVDVNTTASIRARLGIAFDRILVYGTGGAGYVQFRGCSSDTSTACIKARQWRPVAGVGIEYGLDRNWTVGAEYLRYFGTKDISGGFDDTTKVKDVESVRLKLNYRF